MSLEGICISNEMNRRCPLGFELEEAPLPFLRVNLFFESNLPMLSSDFVLRRHLQVDSKKGKAGAR